MGSSPVTWSPFQKPLTLWLECDSLDDGYLSASSLVYTLIPRFLTDLISWLIEGPREIVEMRLKRKQEQI